MKAWTVLGVLLVALATWQCEVPPEGGRTGQPTEGRAEQAEAEAPKEGPDRAVAYRVTMYQRGLVIKAWTEKGPLQNHMWDLNVYTTTGKNLLVLVCDRFTLTYEEE